MLLDQAWKGGLCLGLVCGEYGVRAIFRRVDRGVLWYVECIAG